jgi:uroporphyrin-III C-methyltransferase/precorrin-2 dehydrogenase/sirohydrochlorin ferrochelatase
VGAGPGDPDLLTFKALRYLQRADVVVHDRLVAPEIVDYARRDADRVFVGKARGSHACAQDDINAKLLAYAQQGLKVVRLKGGDPFVFGRGGEERDHLEAHGIPVIVVPGITAATGCAAAGGLPLTDRRYASAVTFVTGHPHDADAPPDWHALATSGQTLAVYMGVGTAGITAERLMAHGLSGETPAAVVERGTMPDQRVLATTLGELGACVTAHGVQPPAMLVIGEVARVLDGRRDDTAATRCRPDRDPAPGAADVLAA